MERASQFLSHNDENSQILKEGGQGQQVAEFEQIFTLIQRIGFYIDL